MFLFQTEKPTTKKNFIPPRTHSINNTKNIFLKQKTQDNKSKTLLCDSTVTHYRTFSKTA